MAANGLLDVVSQPHLREPLWLFLRELQVLTVVFHSPDHCDWPSESDYMQERWEYVRDVFAPARSCFVEKISFTSAILWSHHVGRQAWFVLSTLNWRSWSDTRPDVHTFPRRNVCVWAGLLRARTSVVFGEAEEFLELETTEQIPVAPVFQEQFQTAVSREGQTHFCLDALD